MEVGQYMIVVLVGSLARITETSLAHREIIVIIFIIFFYYLYHYHHLRRHRHRHRHRRRRHHHFRKTIFIILHYPHLDTISLPISLRRLSGPVKQSQLLHPTTPVLTFHAPPSCSSSQNLSIAFRQSLCCKDQLLNMLMSATLAASSTCSTSNRSSLTCRG